MKRSFLTLLLALSTTLAMAQAPYMGSLFTKDDPTPLASIDFSSVPATGTLQAGDVVGNDTITSQTAHQQGFYASYWHRFEDTTLVTYERYATEYPVFLNGTGNLHGCTSPSCMNGFMLLSMEEAYSGWGGFGSSGSFNAWFSLGSVCTRDVPAIYVRMYQRLSRYYYDECWLDYSIDNQTWQTVEFNIHGIDVQTNGTLRGNVHINMPLSCGNQDSVWLRVRWSSNQGYGTLYGCYWMIDDAFIMPIPQNDLSSVKNEYFEGFYHIMPQGLQVPMVWNSVYRNGGLDTQTGIYGSIHHSDTYTGASTEIARIQGADLAFTEDGQVTIDPLGWYDTSFDQTDDMGYLHGMGYVPGVQGVGTEAYLPTDREGIHFVHTDITSDAMPHINGTTAYPKVGYHVNGFNEDNPMAVRFDSVPCAVWGRDNGMLVRNSYYTLGMLPSGSYTTSADANFDWTASEYQLCVTYATGDIVPEDWRIKGVQIVAATTDPYHDYTEAVFTRPQTGLVRGILYEDSIVLEGNNKLAYTNLVETSQAREIQPEEVNDRSSLTYLDFESGYAVVNFEFPTQPRLKTHTSYRIGYQIEEDAFFAPASGYNTGYYDQNNTYHYFSSDAAEAGAGTDEYDGLMASARTFGLPNYQVVCVHDPGDPNAETYYWEYLTVTSVPMIRMIVGPYEEKPSTDISFQCGDHGQVMNYTSTTDYCGQTVSYVTGGQMNVYIVPEEGYVVDKIIINGEMELINDTLGIDEYYGEAFVYGFDVEGDEMTVEVTFMSTTAGIAMPDAEPLRLYPNPATSEVRVEGAEGAISLFDMQGRLVLTSDSPAISLTSLARGIYFVRCGGQTQKLVVK